jgi:hypothetical protein
LGVIRGRVLRILLEKGQGSNELGAVTHRFVVRVPVCDDIRQAMESVRKSYEKGIDSENPEMGEFMMFIEGVCKRGFGEEENGSGVREETDLLGVQNVCFMKKSERRVENAFTRSGAMCADLEGESVGSGVSVYYVGDSLGSTRFRCLVLNIPQSVRSGYKCFFVESLVRRSKGKWKCLPGSVYGKRYVDEFGMVPCSMLYIGKDCTYSDRRQCTMRDHRELMRSLGCAVLVQKNSHVMKRNMDAIAWSTGIEVGNESVDFLSIFTPMFW